MLVDPASVGAELLWVDRGGDITYHGPGQLVGYPVLSVPSGPSATPAYVHEVEQFVIDVLAKVGLPDVGRLDGYPGRLGRSGRPRPRKICAIGARHSRQRTMHGFALNVQPRLAMFGHIVPCGIAGKEVTSLEAEGVAGEHGGGGGGGICRRDDGAGGRGGRWSARMRPCRRR